ncbi:hypothetical protein CDAR_295081 [Caerostris darwini]|uniref:Secreted protein n=1 Tax=Caerostris darwini TaxID=1538125 RepID=A0AAV4UKQ9_9ARAC|nr:hypothetical protein CDAR_295081 [Caerostris darwini]
MKEKNFQSVMNSCSILSTLSVISECGVLHARESRQPSGVVYHPWRNLSFSSHSYALNPPSLRCLLLLNVFLCAATRGPIIASPFVLKPIT